MGYDYIDIGASHLRLNDFHIWTLRHFFCDTILTSTPDSLDADQEKIRALLSYLESWEWLGPGIVTGCDFNTFATTPSQWQLIRSLFNATRERLTQFGDFIPLDYLEEHVNSPVAYYLEPQPVVKFTDIIGYLHALIPNGE